MKKGNFSVRKCLENNQSYAEHVWYHNHCFLCLHYTGSCISQGHKWHHKIDQEHFCHMSPKIYKIIHGFQRKILQKKYNRCYTTWKNKLHGGIIYSRRGKTTELPDSRCTIHIIFASKSVNQHHGARHV